VSQESLLSLAFHTSIIGKALIGPDSVWLDVNEAFLDFFGCSRKKLSDMNFQQVVQLADSDTGLLEEVAMGIRSSCRIEKRHIRQDGTSAWVELFVTLARNSSGKPDCLVVEAVDITQAMNQQADRALFFKLSPDLLAIADRRGFLVEVCPAWTDLLGWSRSELTSRPYTEFVHPDDRQWTLEQAQKIATNNAMRGFRNRYRHKNGGYRWLEWSIPSLLEDRIFCIARDVTHQVQIEEASKLQEEKIRLLIENGSDAFIGMSQDGTITEWNRQAEKMLGWSAQEAIGAEMSTLLAPARYRAQHDQGIRRFLETGKAHIVNKRVELPVLTRNGGELLVEMTVGAVRHGDDYYFATFMRDISHRKAMEAQLHYQATHDFLTGLPNRYEFMSRLEAAIRREARTGEDQHVVLLFIDLDGFKEVNDRLGHDVGDEVLRTFAERLRRGVREEIDTVARLAGDEFVILLEDVAFDRAKQVALAVLTAGSEEFPAVGKQCALSVSVGVIFHRLSESGEELLSRADKAMYVSKQEGKAKASLNFGDLWLTLSGNGAQD
jgi:diguanylate cyclase (GGDEF)-like protein/PAS domain S-box-containing protein